MRSALNSVCAGLVLLVVASAQIQPSAQIGRGVPVRGEIETGIVLTGNVTVELASSGTARSESAPVTPDGRFEFSSVATGAYWLRVIAGNGRVLHEEAVSINGSQPTLTIHIKDEQRANRSSESTISYQQLTHKVPRQAQKAYDKGLQSASKGDARAAAEFFGEAVAVDPEFVDAHNELGAADEKMGKLPEAAEQFQKAIDLAPEHHLALPNLSIVLAKMRRFHEAAEVARRALRVLPGMAKMQYLLAVCLLADHKEPAEAIKNLRSASAEIPKAHLVAAEALVDEGKTDEAVLELEQYLATKPKDEALRAKVEARITELKH